MDDRRRLESLTVVSGKQGLAVVEEVGVVGGDEEEEAVAPQFSHFTPFLYIYSISRFLHIAPHCVLCLHPTCLFYFYFFYFHFIFVPSFCTYVFF